MKSAWTQWEKKTIAPIFVLHLTSPPRQPNDNPSSFLPSNSWAQPPGLQASMAPIGPFWRPLQASALDHTAIFSKSLIPNVFKRRILELSSKMFPSVRFINCHFPQKFRVYLWKVSKCQIRGCQRIFINPLYSVANSSNGLKFIKKRAKRVLVRKRNGRLTFFFNFFHESVNNDFKPS